jgi:plastocyanin
MNQTKTLFSILLTITAFTLIVFPGCSGSSSTSAVVQGGVLTTTSPGVQTSAPPAAGAIPPASTQAPGQAITLNLIAQKMAFDQSVITVPAGVQVTINFENKDSVGHNFAAYIDQAATTPIFVGKIITGPSTIVYTFTAPANPGAYFFRCDPHASFMKGQFIVQ